VNTLIKPELEKIKAVLTPCSYPGKFDAAAVIRAINKIE
jgi:hypothetical protein